MLEPLPAIEPRLYPANRFARDLPAGAALGWLARGWADLWTRPEQGLIYGLFVLALSGLVIGGLMSRCS